jgi:glycosyltransferase involved in cell wall biosynthesis
VADNNSSDETGKIARHMGAVVIEAATPGYGSACLAAIEYLKHSAEPPDIVVFLDGDYSDFPEEMPLLTEPIRQDHVDLVIGSRVLGTRSKGALAAHQLFGNWLATRLIRMIYGYHFTDLGPFRAISWNKLLELRMADQNYGWTVEMQVKAARLRFKTAEVPVSYRKRIGKSKVSGTIKGSVLAGYKILWTIFKLS